MSRVTIAGQRLGVFARLARGRGHRGRGGRRARPFGGRARCCCWTRWPRSSTSTSAATRTRSRRRGRKWLDPASDDYIGTYIEHSHDYWDWWNRLEEIVRTGEGIEIHDFPADDPHWETYIRGQFELARISSPEVAKALRLPHRPESLLDVAGGHGWYSAELCRRHPTLRATVLDLPGSAAVGRRIIAEQGMSDRVQHVEGDMMSADLRRPARRRAVLQHRAPPLAGAERRAAAPDARRAEAGRHGRRCSTCGCPRTTAAGRCRAARPLLLPDVRRRDLHASATCGAG